VRDSFEKRNVDLRLFGAGVSIDEVTLRGLARALSGSYDSVSSGGSLAEQTEVLITGLRMPLVVTPTLEGPSDMAELEPRQLPNLRLGEELVVVGKRSGDAPFSVTLRGRLNGAAYTLIKPVSIDTTPGALPFAARLWAQARIHELETSGDAGSAKEIIQLSQQFRVMSRETSWLVLENEQMFAEFGVGRSKFSVEPLAPGSQSPAADRGAVSRELDQLDSSPLGSGSAAPAGPSAADDGARRESGAAPAPPAAAPAPAPPPNAKAAPAAPAAAAPLPAPGSAGGGLAGIGSDVARAEGGSAGSSKIVGPRGNASVGGADFMKAVWSIWFGKIDQPSLGDAMIANM